MQTPCLGVLLAFHVNQVIQPLFFTEFLRWAILIWPLFISLIQLYPEGRSHLPFEFPGSTGAGPQQKNIFFFYFNLNSLLSYSKILIESESISCSVVSDSLWPHGLQPARLLCPWNSPGKNTAIGCHSILKGDFLTSHWTPVSCIERRFFTIWAILLIGFSYI